MDLGKLSDLYSHNKGVCSICGSKSHGVEQFIMRIKDFGEYSYSVYICKDHIQAMVIGDTLFMRIDDKLFYDPELSCGLYKELSPVRSREHFEWLKHKDEESFLRGINL